MIDDKDRLIARQCAFKGAIDAIMRSPTEFRTFEEIAAFVAAATDRFEAIINKRNGGLVAAAKAAGAKPVSATQCPVHHKAKMGNYGLFCPTKVGSEWCKWRGPEGLDEEGEEIDFE